MNEFYAIGISLMIRHETKEQMGDEEQKVRIFGKEIKA